MSIFSLIKPLAYLSLPVFILHTLSQSSPIVRYYVRIGVYISSLGLCSAWGALLSLPMTLAGRRFDVNWVVARTFYLIAGRALGLKVEVEGEEYLDTCPAIFVGNHQSMLDILYIGKVMPKRTSIMAKKELQWVPLLGQFMTLSGAVFVDRGNNAAAIRSLAAAGETIRSRRTSLWMFPEGTRSMRAYHDMKPFKKGAFHMAVEAGVPIVPIVCENYWRLYRKGVFDEGTLKVKVLPPISTEGLSSADVGALAIRVREMMVEALREISGPAPEPPAAPSQKVSESSSIPSMSQSLAPEKVQAEPAPLASIPSIIEPGPDVAPVSAPDSRSESRASTNLSDDFSSPPSTSTHSREEGSEAGVETEEDEGMVLVGHPNRP